MNSDDKKKAPKAAEDKRIARGLLGMAALTERVARPALGREGQAAAQVFGRWRDIVGPSLAAVSAPEKIMRARGTGGAILHVRVNSGAAAAMIHPQTPQILERLNTYLGPDAIRQIKVTQGPLSMIPRRPPPPASPPLSDIAVAEAEQSVSGIGSEPVRHALARLGARLKSRH
jgi:hypothetical protein